MSNDFYAMLNYLKRDLSDEDIMKELQIAGLSKIPNFNEYIDLVKRTRAELKRLIISEGTKDILEYTNL